MKYHARFVVGWLARKGCADSDAGSFEIDRVHGLGNDRDRGLHHDHLGDRLGDHLGNHLGIGFDYRFESWCFPGIDFEIDFDSDSDFRIEFAFEPSSLASGKVVLKD